MDRSVNYFTFTQKLMSMAGLWYTQTYRQRLLRYYVIGFMSICTILGESCQLFASNFDLRSSVRLLQNFVPAVCGVAQYTNTVLHFDTVHKIQSFIHEDSQFLKEDTQMKIMQKYVYYGNLFSLTMAVIMYLHMLMNISSSLFRIILTTKEIRSDLDIYPIISCFDYFSNRGTYSYPIIICQIIANLTLATVALASYIKFFTYILHACARLSIIKYKIYSPFIRNKNIADAQLTPIDLSPWIIDIIQRLARTTKFMTLVNTMCEKNYLFQMFLAFLLLILDFLCVPVLLEHKTTKKDVLLVVIYILGTLFIIYINCYIGQRLLDYSTDVYREATLVPYHEMSLKTQKLLLTTLIMSSKPYGVSIGKIYVASHDWFSNLLRSSLSFAMVVHSLETM